MGGISSIAAIAHSTAQASDQARAAQQAARSDLNLYPGAMIMIDAAAVERNRRFYNAQTDQYFVMEQGKMRTVPREAAEFVAPYQYPSETPADWVAQEDAKDRELSRWISEVMP